MIFKTPLALSLAGLVGLSACTDPATRIQDPNYRTENGALAGAVGGAILGSAFKNDKNGALHGAILGGLVGGMVGANLDQQAADLRDRLGNPNVTVTKRGGNLVVNLPDDVLFATDSAAVRPDLQRELSGIAANLVTYPNSTIRVIGHTDNTGTAAHNMDLSQQRAYAVANILMSSGVPAGRLTAVGRGEDQPVATNLTVAGRAQNRRVEIIIHPNN